MRKISTVPEAISKSWNACIQMLILTHSMIMVGTAIFVYSPWIISVLVFFFGIAGASVGSLAALRMAKEVGRLIQSSDPLSD